MQELLPLFEDVHGSATQRYAKCPAHADKHASLSIGTGADGRILLTCHAGCTTEAIVEAVGLTVADLFADSPANPAQAPRVITTKAEAHYLYMDIAGTQQFEKRRYPGKNFKWFRLTEQGWEISRGQLPPVALFNVDEVQDKPGVFWAEGEKDVCTLMKHGLTAVCIHSGAAGKPTREQLEPLRGKSVAILPDNDEAGRKHAQNVAMALQGIAASVRVLDLKQIDPELPEKGDISDIYEKLGEAVTGKLKELANTTPDWTSDHAPQNGLIALDGITPEPPRYFWEPYLRLHNVNVIRGDGGAGKTMFVFALAAAITTGKMPEGMPGTLDQGQGAVIYYGAEDDPAEYANRAILCGCDRKFLHVVGEGSTLPQLSDTETFRQQVQQTGAKLIIFDPIQSFLGAGTDMNKANEVRPMLDALRALCREMQCTAIIIEHMNKATQQKAQYRGIGTVDIINSSRSTIMVGWHPEERGVSVAIQIKANAKYGEPIAFRIDGEGRFTWRGTCDVTEDEVANARRYTKESAVADVVDPVLALVLALMEKHPDGWIGTAQRMLTEGSALVDCALIGNERTIGKRLPGIHHELQSRGITWRKIHRNHAFSKNFQTSTFDDTFRTNTTFITDENVQLNVKNCDSATDGVTFSGTINTVTNAPNVANVQELSQPSAPREQAKTLYLQGKKYKEIAETLGVEYKTVAKWKQRDGWEVNT